MPRSESTGPYKWLAEYYDLLFAPARSPIDKAREHILAGILPKVKVACDLACGTGITAMVLARQGIRMYAVDGSPGMCQVAREKAQKAFLPVEVVESDMRVFRLPEPVDLITSEFDAVNHVPARADFARVAKAAARALKPGGYFYFDVNNALGFRRYWTGVVWLERKGVVAVLRNGNDGGQRAWCDVEWFIRQGDFWRRQHERVEEVCWTTGEIRGALREAGFGRLRAFDALPFFGNDSLIRRGCRTFYLARKL